MLIYLQMLETPDEQDRFEQFYYLYRDVMFLAADRLLHNVDDAEDAVHQAFISLIGIFGRITDIAAAETRALAVMIAQRRAVDIIRERDRLTELDEDALPATDLCMPGDSPLAAAISRLSPRYREALFLRYVFGYSTREFAPLLGVSSDSARKLLWRAKQRLKELLDEGGKGPAAQQ